MNMIASSACMNDSQSDLRLLLDDLKSSQHVLRRNTLKKLETTFLPNLDSRTAFSILLGENEEKSEALGHILIKELSNGNSPEICREKSAVCLQLILIQSFREEGCYITEHTSLLRKFYIEICSMFHARFLPSLASSNENKPVEEAEEIRLILVEIMSYIVGNIRQNETLTHCEHITTATSLLCESLSTAALCDKYPELKRASCVLLKAIAKVFPHVVRMHGESLLRTITGQSIKFGEPAGGIGHEIEQNVCASSKTCFLRHRHAKTRSLGLEAITDVILCLDISSEDLPESDLMHSNLKGPLPINTDINSPPCMNIDENDGRHSSDLLCSLVLPSLESFPPYDRSAAVRIALSKTVGKLLMLRMKGCWCSLNVQTSYEKICDSNRDLLEKRQIPTTGRLLALLIMGLSDKAESVQSAASAGFQSIDEMWGKCQNEAPSPKLEGVLFFSFFALDVIAVLLLNVSNTFSVEEKLRSLQTLSVTIQILNQNSCQFTVDNVVPYWDELVMNRILSVLFESLKENEKEIFQAAIDCSDALGRLKLSRCSALRIIVPALSGKSSCLNERPKYSSCEVTMHYRNSEKMLCSTPQHFTSALYLLAGLLRGGCSSESSEALLEISEINECICVVAIDRVLEAVFVSSETAIALFDVCCALGKRTSAITKAHSDEKSNDCGLNSDGDNNVIKNILHCCVYLLGCPEKYMIQEPVLILVRSLSCALLGEGSSIGLLDQNFKDIFYRITKKLHGSSDVRQERQISNPDLCAFDALLRNTGGVAVGQHFDIISPILEIYLAKNAPVDSSQLTTSGSDYETKLFIMALIESIVSDPTFPKNCLHLFSEKLIHSAIIPNLAWQVGGMASALRKLSAAVLFAIISSEGATTPALSRIAPRLLPILKSNLSDDDASTRELVLASLEKIFAMLPGALGQEVVLQLYPDLIKCLDDSSDSVRFTACNALKQFLKVSFPESFLGTAINYIVERLFIHMDDPELTFQEKAFDVLVVALDIDSSVVSKNIETALLSHKSKDRIMRLKELVKKKGID